jgi:hypothetical protein
MSEQRNDNVQLLLLYCHRIVQEGRFIQQSLPNVESGAVERSLLQLQAVHAILAKFSDSWLSPDEINNLINIVIGVSAPLQTWLDNPPPAYHPSTQKLPGSGRGRPKYDLDLDRALELHDMELSWDQVAKAMGVTRQTLYNQLNASGRSTARRPFTNIGDDDLDLLIAEISDHHPLAGSVIVRGHLEAIGVHIPLNDIKDSLRRVNAIGVSLRLVTFISFNRSSNFLSLIVGGMDQSDAVFTRFEGQTLSGTMMGMRNFVPGASTCMGALMGTLVSSYTSNVRTTNAQLLSRRLFWRRWKCMAGPVASGGILGQRTMV